MGKTMDYVGHVISMLDVREYVHVAIAPLSVLDVEENRRGATLRFYVHSLYNSGNTGIRRHVLTEEQPLSVAMGVAEKEAELRGLPLLVDRGLGLKPEIKWHPDGWFSSAAIKLEKD